MQLSQIFQNIASPLNRSRKESDGKTYTYMCRKWDKGKDGPCLEQKDIYMTRKEIHNNVPSKLSAIHCPRCGGMMVRMHKIGRHK